MKGKIQMLKLMSFENNNIEVLNYNGEVLFNPYHVGECLGISKSNVRNYVQQMNKNQVIALRNSNVRNMDIRKLPNRGQNFITKSGVYKLIFKSRNPNAERFQDWVTDIVLPQVEKTGGYIPINSQDDEKTILAKALQISERTLHEKDNIIEAKTKALSIAQPKADIYDKLMNADGYFSFNVAAKELGIGRNKLMRLLRERGILFRDGLSNIAYQKYCNSGYFVVKHSIGKNGYACGVTKVTAKGLEYIHKVLNTSSSTMGVAK